MCVTCGCGEKKAKVEELDQTNQFHQRSPKQRNEGASKNTEKNK